MARRQPRRQARDAPGADDRRSDGPAPAGDRGAARGRAADRRPRHDAGPAAGTPHRSGEPARPAAPARGRHRRRDLRGARRVQAVGALDPRRPHARAGGRGRRPRRGGQGASARSQRPTADPEPHGRGARGAPAGRRRSPLAHPNHQAARPRPGLGRSAADPWPPPRAGRGGVRRRGATVRHHGLDPGDGASRRADTPGRRHRAPWPAHAGGGSLPRRVARRGRPVHARGVAARPPRGGARSPRGARLAPEPHRARAPASLRSDRADARRAGRPGPHGVPRHRTPGPGGLPAAAGRAGRPAGPRRPGGGSAC